jgi:hypothetical protein
MNTRSWPSKYNCLEKVAPLEPFFVLRAQDVLASGLVELWAKMAEEGGTDRMKVAEARNTAIMMRQWHNRKHPD